MKLLGAKRQTLETRKTAPRQRTVAAVWAGCAAVKAGCFGSLATLMVLTFGGCGGDQPSVRDIQRRREVQQRASTEVDYVEDALQFLANYVELDARQARQRISGLLNNWLDEHPLEASWEPTKLLVDLPSKWREFPPLQGLAEPRFVDEDAEYLRLNYLLARVVTWMDEGATSDPLFADWIASQRDVMGEQSSADLLRAAQLFDWTVRNIQLEPLQANSPGPQTGPLPLGMEFRGPGYRQTTYETLYRGAGDKLQRTRVFIQLCRQAGIDACVLQAKGKGAEGLDALWAVGVRVGEQLYLFEPALGLPIPGPDQMGIATLAQAREDASVLRRLNVPGWFDYPLDQDAIQENLALLDAPAESLSHRMLALQEALVGDERMVLGLEADASGEALLAMPGIDAVQLWELSYQAPAYRAIIEEMAKSDQQLAIWRTYNWGMLSDGFPLALARWEHLQGDFQRGDMSQGAPVMYMEMRLPEFEIDALDTKVDLQQLYNVRRMADQTDEQFRFQIGQVQRVMRMAKRAASYWISLIHYDLGEFETAVSWFDKRVLVEDQESEWKPGARYNLARALERSGELERAEALYKTNGDPQEHGNRIRARLIARE